MLLTMQVNKTVNTDTDFKVRTIPFCLSGSASFPRFDSSLRALVVPSIRIRAERMKYWSRD